MTGFKLYGAQERLSKIYSEGNNMLLKALSGAGRIRAFVLPFVFLMKQRILGKEVDMNLHANFLKNLLKNYKN